MEFKKAIVFLVLTGFPYLLGIPHQALAISCDVEKSLGREDKTLFGKHCGVCHSMSGLWVRVGPPLNGLFEKKQLVTGKPVTDENVREVILKGGPGLMPGFQYMLTPDHVEELLRYLKQTRCPDIPAGKGKE